MDQADPSEPETVDEALVLGEPIIEGTGYEAAEDADPGPATTSLALATWALFTGIALMLGGAGLFGTLIAVRSELDGFGSLLIGPVSYTHLTLPTIA